MNKKINKIILIMLMFFIGCGFAFADGCETILGDVTDENDLAYWINYGLGVLRIVAPSFVILYGTIDIFKAVISSSEDQMKKAQKMVVKRIIIAVSLFFVPTFVGLLLDMVSSAGTEGLKFERCFFN